MNEPCTSPRIELADAHERRVSDVMVKRPKTLAADVTVADVRRLFENPRVRTALLVDGDALAGAIDCEALDPSAPDDDRARDHLAANLPRIEPDALVSEALDVLRAAGTRRLAVVDADGTTLRGLVCLDRPGEGFCTDTPAA
jgi:CBS domain-containing protein